MKTVYDILCLLRETTSTKEKVEILKKHKGNNALEDYLFCVYNPELNYYFSGLKEIPERVTGGIFSHDVDPNGRWVTMDEIEGVVKLFSTRQVTGNEAKNYIHDLYTVLNDESIELMQMLFARDVKSGIGITSINKVWAQLIPEYAYMRCELVSNVDVDSWDWNSGIYVQEKYDGQFANVFVNEDGEAFLISTRNGTPYPKTALTGIRQQIQETGLTSHVLHGELVVYHSQTKEVMPREVGNGILNSIIQDGEQPPEYDVVLHVWDGVGIHAYGQGIDDTEYHDRLLTVSILFDSEDGFHVRMAKTDVVHSLREAYDIYKSYLSAGGEGAIIKNPSMIWKNGTSKDQVKLKLEVIVTLKPTALTPGKGKNEKYFGSITCQSSDGELVVNVSGMSDAVRKKIFENQEWFFQTLVDVKSNAILPPSENNENYSLFLPRLVEIREDKTVADDLDRIRDEFRSAIEKV